MAGLPRLLPAERIGSPRRLRGLEGGRRASPLGPTEGPVGGPVEGPLEGLSEGLTGEWEVPTG